MKPLLSYWILDFVLRQPIDDCLLQELFLSLPTPQPHNSHRLHKAILLRSLRRTTTISEQTLHVLERIEELDRDHTTTNNPKSPVLPSLKAAYCAVAAECTVRYLRDAHGDSTNTKSFSDAVFRIWKCRVADLRVSDAAEALFSEELWYKSREMEKAVGKPDRPDLRDRLLRDSDAKETALMAVRVYVDDAFAEMGPSWLELKAVEVLRKGGGLVSGLVGSDETTVLEGGGGGGDFPSSQLDGGSRMPMPPPQRPGTGRNPSSQMPLVPPPAEAQKRNASTRFRVTYSKSAGAGLSKEHDSLSTPEVDRMKQALKSSCAVLHTAVEDPLPGAVANAAELVDKVPNSPLNTKEPGHNLNGEGVYDPGPSNRVMDDNRSDGTATDRRDLVDHDKRTQPGLMDRNPTAHTFEWEDSIESLSEGSPCTSKKIRLPSLKKRRVSPLNIPKPTKYARRRAVKKWSGLEEDTLREGVKKHGKGNWKFILSCYPSIFEHRTEVDLKDKWRNMTRKRSGGGVAAKE